MPKRKFNCVYCGKSKGITNDHVPPKCLFPHPRPSDLITVPCCEICHCPQSEDDEYFRAIIATSGGSDKHPAAAKLWKGEIIRSLKKPEKKGFRNLIWQSIKPVDVVTKGGIFLGRSMALDYDLSRINNVLERTVKGLFYWYKRYRLSDDFMVKISIHPDLELIPNYVLELLESITWKDIGEGIFTFKFVFFEDEPNGSLWLLSFYESWPIICLTAPK